jgi:hypothetical protein
LSCRRQNQPALGTQVCPFTLIGEDLSKNSPQRRQIAESELQKTQPCVLLIDEVDKVDGGFDALLLAILCVAAASICAWSSRP